jgi:hypothetical protein
MADNTTAATEIRPIALEPISPSHRSIGGRHGITDDAELHGDAIVEIIDDSRHQTGFASEQSGDHPSPGIFL